MNVLITGGTSGLGKATVELLAKDGHDIWFSYLATEEFTKVAKEMMAQNEKVKAIPLNFCEQESVDDFCEQMKGWDIDVLVNCTYVGKPQTTYFHKIDPEEFTVAFQNNIIPTVKITLYAANKAYLMELSNVWNKEYTRYNITSNCILPAYMQTKFAEVDERILEQMVKEHPLKKLLTPEEVALAVKFFVDAPQHVNGVKMPVNAGTLLMV